MLYNEYGSDVNADDLVLLCQHQGMGSKLPSNEISISRI